MTVLLAYATSAAGAAALEFAIDEARRREADLVLFPLDGSTPAESDVDYDRVSIEHPMERSRDAAGDLVEAAARLEADVVVVGMRRRSPTGKLLLGSDAQRIILDSPAPVVSVKTR